MILDFNLLDYDVERARLGNSHVFLDCKPQILDNLQLVIIYLRLGHDSHGKKAVVSKLKDS